MKQFWKTYGRRHLWLAALLLFALFFHGIKHSVSAMEWVTSQITTPIKNGLSFLCSYVSFSVAELCWVVAIAWVVIHVGGTFWGLAKQPRKGFFLYGRLLTLCCAVGTVYVLFCWLWSANYYTSGVAEKLGIETGPISVEQLADTTRYVAQQLNESSKYVSRNSEGYFQGSKREILLASSSIYENIQAQYPVLAAPARQVKEFQPGVIMSYLNLTGFFFPFTGEANVNTDCPLALVPSTIAHEIAHQRGVAPEQEANFVAVLACTTSQNPVYEYSGWLMAYIHLSNALYSADPDQYAQIRDSLEQGVRQDLSYNSLYWSAFSTPVAKASTSINDAFLKSNGQQQGVKSYGVVADLLVAYYQDALN